jgi:hypothetical protein
MKKKAIILVLVIILSACSKQSDLSVYNDTGKSIKVILGSTIHQLMPNDPPAVETCYLNSFILFGETKKVSVIVEGQVFLKHKDFSVEMKPGKDRSYHVELDRAGLQISNPTVFTITAVDLKREDDNEWVFSVLSAPDVIYSEELSAIISVLEYYDNIRIEYQIGIDQYAYKEDLVELNIGETTTYVFLLD